MLGTTSSNSALGIWLLIAMVGLFAVGVAMRRSVGWAWLVAGRGPRVPRLPGDDTLYVVPGNDGAPDLSKWPPPGTTGSIPRGGRVVSLGQLLDSLGSEVWLAHRDGNDVRLLERAESFNDAAALSWAADCVEHLAHDVGGISLVGVTVEPSEEIEQAVAACVAFARKYASERRYDAAAAEELDGAVSDAQKHKNRSAWSSVRQANREDTTPAGAYYNAALRDGRRRALRTIDATFWLLLEAAHALCDANRMEGARRATGLCRKAASYHKLSEVVSDQAGQAEANKGFMLDNNPLAAGRGLRSAASKVSALVHGGDAEAIWQMRRLSEYLGLSTAAQATPTAA